MWPSASSATSRCSSVSGRICTASAMFAPIRRATAANASDSCGATGACSGGSTYCLTQSPQTLYLVQHFPRHMLLGGRRDAPRAAVGRQDRNLVIAGIEADAGPGDVIDHDRVEALAPQLLAPVLDGIRAVLGGKSDQHLVVASLGRQRAQHVVGGLELDRRGA